VRDNRTRFGWQPVFHPAGNMVLFNIPTVSDSLQFVSNSTTGAWCRFTGMDATCWEVFNDDLYFGGDGEVFQADTGLDDNGVDIEADAKTAFSYFGDKGRLKKFSMVRPNLTLDGALDVEMVVNVDFEDRHPTTSPTFTPVAGADWGVAVWDEAEWGAGEAVTKSWQTVSALGHAASVRIKSSSQNGNIRWNSTDWLYETGAFI